MTSKDHAQLEAWLEDQACIEGQPDGYYYIGPDDVTNLHATVAALVRLAREEEREACAKLCGHSNGRIRGSHKHLAAALRARGEKA